MSGCKSAGCPNCSGVCTFEIKNKQNLELVKKNKELNEFIKEKGLDIQDIENNTNNDMER